MIPSCLRPMIVGGLTLAAVDGSLRAADPAIRHSYLVMGGQTAIIAEDGQTEWKYRSGTRDGFVLPSGNVLLAFSDKVEEVAYQVCLAVTFTCSTCFGIQIGCLISNLVA